MIVNVQIDALRIKTKSVTLALSKSNYSIFPYTDEDVNKI